MTTISAADPRLAPAPDPTPSSPLNRIWSIAKAEIKLLARNRTVMATAILLGPLTAAFMAWLNVDAAGLPGFSVLVTNLVFSWGAMLALYYNLTSIYVARREEGVFKRLLTGEATPGETIAAAAVPSSLVFVAQVVLTAVVVVFFFDAPPFTNPLLLVLALAFAVVIFASFAAFSSTFTSSSEAAQYSTLPLLMVFIFFSGTNFPLNFLPEGVQTFATYTPLNAMGELVTIGMGGFTLDGESATGFLESFRAAGFPLAVLLGWTVLAMAITKQYMRYEPRR
ncbi:MAG TPA: ABC transporter permease [Actinomycetales bacterium]|nr:ABC transporter permease [Actinomycetales bacterium]